MLINLNLRDDILLNFPNFEYFNCRCPTKLMFSEKNNLVGDQQEAFILYWILKQIREHSGIGLDIGCGQDPHIFSVGINDYYGDCHPQYGGKYNPHITSLAENITCLNEGTFSWIIASHILEHVNNPIVTFRNWIKFLKKDGLMIVILPDSNFEILKWDITHKNFYTPDEFRRDMIELNRDIMQEIELDTLRNNFSFNYVGRKI